MKAAFLDKPKQFDLREINLPEPLANEVRIKLKKVGICGSDMHLFQGHRLLSQPTVIGHEGLGFVDKIGANVKIKIWRQSSSRAKYQLWSMPFLPKG